MRTWRLEVFLHWRNGTVFNIIWMEGQAGRWKWSCFEGIYVLCICRKFCWAQMWKVILSSAWPFCAMQWGMGQGVLVSLCIERVRAERCAILTAVLWYPYRAVGLCLSTKLIDVLSRCAASDWCNSLAAGSCLFEGYSSVCYIAFWLCCRPQLPNCESDDNSSFLFHVLGRCLHWRLWNLLLPGRWIC